ncbi:COX aromatic rich motif-containing protein [Mesorhizobium atlanticum]
MNFPVRAVSADAFASWASSLHGNGVLTPTPIARLARQSINMPPVFFGQVDPDLFNAVLHQTPPPGPDRPKRRPESRR